MRGLELALGSSMRITVSSGDIQLADETRTYAEYRLFTSVARHEGLVRSVHVDFRRDAAAHRPFLCTVAVDLGRSGCIKTQARAAHPVAAIDRAAGRTAWLLGQGRMRRVPA